MLDPLPAEPLAYRVKPPPPFFSAQKEVPIVIQTASDIQRRKKASAAASAPATLPTADALKPEGMLGRDAWAQAKAVALAAQLAQTVMLPLMFHQKTPGDYACCLLLRSVVDMRLFELRRQAQSHAVSHGVEFTPVAQQPVTQDNTITNHTAQEWTLRAAI
jgi:hypothetical protein